MSPPRAPRARRAGTSRSPARSRARRRPGRSARAPPRREDPPRRLRRRRRTRVSRVSYSPDADARLPGRRVRPRTEARVESRARKRGRKVVPVFVLGVRLAQPVERHREIAFVPQRQVTRLRRSPLPSFIARSRAWWLVYGPPRRGHTETPRACPRASRAASSRSGREWGGGGRAGARGVVRAELGGLVRGDPSRSAIAPGASASAGRRPNESSGRARV